MKVNCLKFGELEAILSQVLQSCDCYSIIIEMNSLQLRKFATIFCQYFQSMILYLVIAQINRIQVGKKRVIIYKIDELTLRQVWVLDGSFFKHLRILYLLFKQLNILIILFSQNSSLQSIFPQQFESIICPKKSNNKHIKKLIQQNTTLFHLTRMIPESEQQRQTIKSIQQNLPIYKYKQEILQTIRKNRVTVICGQTGSGKTTQVPQYLFSQYNKILITQPRRISAITLAERVSYEMGYNLGEEIGYNVRFQEKRSHKTKVTFMTDGMAIRELMVRKQFDVFVLDQAHERSINTDVLIAVLKKILFQTKMKIKIVIMSATIDSAKFMNFYNTDALINIEGRSFPTEIYNLFEPTENYLDAAFNAIMQVHFTQQKGDILAFLTGQDQINTLFKKIQKTNQTHKITNLKPLMLYSALPSQYQHEIFVPQKGENPPRRVILSTNIAETSVTINGVRYVIDCGFMKIRVYDPQKMLDVLTVVPVSKANALQRSGRAGRQAKGKCYRLYLKNNFDELPDQMLPQILRSQLSGPILQLKAIGIEQIFSLDFMDRPSDQTLKSCIDLLREIKCLKENEEKITEYGFEVSKIPMPPILSHLLISSLEYKCSGIVLSMLSILSIESLFYSASKQGQRDKKGGVYEILKKYLPIINKASLSSGQSGPASNSIQSAYSYFKKDSSSLMVSDHLAKVNLLHEYINCKNRTTFCKQNMLNKNNIKRAVLIRDQLEDYLKQIIAERKKKCFFTNIGGLGSQKQNEQKLSVNETKMNSESISNWLKCMEKCCVYNTAKLSKQGHYLINKTGEKAFIHPESLCFYIKEKPSVIVFNQIVKTTKTYLRDITPIN